MRRRLHFFVLMRPLSFAFSNRLPFTRAPAAALSLLLLLLPSLGDAPCGATPPPTVGAPGRAFTTRLSSR